jgi:hypothetical protein
MTLQKHVEKWLKEAGKNYEAGEEGAWKDLEYGGCQSGMVSQLIYYKDTLSFYKKYQEEINELLVDALDNTGSSVNELFGDKWDKTDPLARDTNNRNLLAWFGFEETAYRIAGSKGW